LAPQIAIRTTHLVEIKKNSNILQRSYAEQQASALLETVKFYIGLPE
jgi:hypothetical protein